MTEASSSLKTAISIMRMARALLDRTDGISTTAVCHLQAAIDAATGEMPVSDGDGVAATIASSRPTP